MACLSFGFSAEACSLILWNTNDQAIVAARTWDLYIDEKPRLAYLPRGVAHLGVAEGNAARWTSKFASAVLTAFDSGSGDGMNEAGLSAHLLYLHGAEYEPADDRPGVANLLWAQYVLDNYATVTEALAGLETVRVVSTKALGREWPVHLAIEDASGDSAVLEFVKGRLVVHHGKDVTVMTNEPPLDEQLANLKRYIPFGGKLTMPGDIDPMSRFVRASSYLKTLPKPADRYEAVSHLAGVARNVAVPFGALDTSGGESTDTWPTRWSTVVDLTHKVYYVMPVNSPAVFWVDFAQLDARSSKILAVDPYDIGLSGDVSARLNSSSPMQRPFPLAP
ncbi:linear amide C-N hydrolase [Methylosinus sp. Sm6]|uniref:linear amide C-N hydrolase n=1 Tax=Methylosinus sp. Sm6 TaxID=2866948 RepID=UPI001C9982D2|nr:linear amide C-N hydrolase [Methylosinus sp. Sm6]MBY6242121.1 linear amide C-N hydrolase [Methylosinus sp. Sm6]